MMDAIFGFILGLLWWGVKWTVICTVVACLFCRLAGGLSKNELMDDAPLLTAFWLNDRK